MPERDEPSPEWARVRIMLNIGDVERATGLARQVADATMWDLNRAVRCGLAYVLGVEDIPPGWAFFYRTGDFWLMLVNDRVLDEFAFCRYMFDFADACKRMSGSGWRRYDRENWRMLRQMRRAELEREDEVS
jgi:hypothetical protein